MSDEKEFELDALRDKEPAKFFFKNRVMRLQGRELASRYEFTEAFGWSTIKKVWM